MAVKKTTFHFIISCTISLEIIIIGCREFIDAFYDILAAMLILTLWMETNDFITSLKISKQQVGSQIMDVLKLFEYLKKLSELVNQALGINMCLYILEIVFGCAFYLDFLVDPAEYGYGFVLNVASAFYFVTLLIPVILAADIEHKVIYWETLLTIININGNDFT